MKDRVVLTVRHGHCHIEDGDEVLSNFGVDQARWLAKKALNHKTEAILYSPAKRTEQMAQIVNAMTGVPIKPCDHLWFGDGGMIKDEIEAFFQIINLIKKHEINPKVVILITHFEGTQKIPHLGKKHFPMAHWKPIDDE